MKIKKIISFFSFICLVIVIYNLILPIFENKSTEDLSKEYRNYADHTFDVMFFGSSAMKNAIYPLQLFNDFGITSYNLGCGSQSIPSSYYLIKEAIREQSPKLIVLDCIFVKHNTKYLSEEHLHYVSDVMNYPEKLQLIADFFPMKSRINFLFEMGIYHERYNSLNKLDFQKTSDLYTYGAKVHYDSRPFDDNYEIISESTAIPEVNEEYLLKIIKLCKDKNIKLLLTVMPLNYSAVNQYMNRKEWQKYFNYIKEIADENQVDYINFMYAVKETNISAKTDYDGIDGGSHLNYYGASKMTSFIGNYIKKHYNIPDKRDDVKYSFLKDDLAIFDKYAILKDIQSNYNFSSYLIALKKLSEYNYSIILSVRDIQGQNLPESIVNKLKELGFENTGIFLTNEHSSFIGIINNGKVVYEQSNPESSSYSGKLNGQNIEVKSKTYFHGNFSEIKIGSIEYSKNCRGINIVIVDNVTREIVDSVAFDTYLPEIPCIR